MLRYQFIFCRHLRKKIRSLPSATTNVCVAYDTKLYLRMNSSFVALEKYLFIAITPRSTLTRCGSNYNSFYIWVK